MKIVVFGANGPTGRLVTRMGLERGYAVTAVTRSPERFPIAHPLLHVEGGDVFDEQSVSRAVVGQDAVLSALGVPYIKKEITTYSVGTAAMLKAMSSAGVRRLVCVSSSAVDPQAGPHGGFFFERVLQPYVAGVLGKTLYDDMKRMEALLPASEADWTIMRPSGLFDAGAVSDYGIAERYLPQKFTARIDLADAMLRQLDDRRFVRTSVAVATSQGAPSVMQLMMREAFKRPPKSGVPGSQVEAPAFAAEEKRVSK